VSCQAGPGSRQRPHRGTLLRTAAAVLLATLLLAPPAALAQGRASAGPRDPGSLLSAVWSFLTALLPGGESLDNRCTIDPNGGTSCGGAGLETRCTIDPNGGTSCGPGF
jgi:hypothetical protein